MKIFEEHTEEHPLHGVHQQAGLQSSPKVGTLKGENGTLIGKVDSLEGENGTLTSEVGTLIGKVGDLMGQRETALASLRSGEFTSVEAVIAHVDALLQG